MPTGVFSIQRHCEFYTTQRRLTVLTVLHNGIVPYIRSLLRQWLWVTSTMSLSAGSIPLFMTLSKMIGLYILCLRGGSFALQHPLISHSNYVFDAQLAPRRTLGKSRSSPEDLLQKCCHHTLFPPPPILSQQVIMSNQTAGTAISKTQRLRSVASKIFQKIVPSKGKEDIDLEELSSTEIQVARFVAFIRPTEAPQIIDLKAVRRSIRPQLPRIYTLHSSEPRSQADLNSPELHLQKSFEDPRRSPTETGTPSRRNPQQVFVFEATSDRSGTAALDGLLDYEGYDLLDSETSDLDWSLLDLPENVYGRLANESRHSLL